MLISIGPRRAPEDLADLLLECHQRIRTFIGIAEEIGRRDNLPEAEVVEGGGRCLRYFGEALPLHVEDEEQSLLPRLRGRSEEVDDALGAMQAQHEEHHAQLETFLEALGAVVGEPASVEHRRRLREAAARLSADFERHLALEEQVIFPAVRELLSEEERSAVMGELRARRQRAMRTE